MDEKKGILGIDAGGTFTDLVFMSRQGMSVGASVKVSTRHDDILSTIEEGVGLILSNIDARLITDVHLASTLATNATVENKMAAAGLMLVGYDEKDVRDAVSRNLFGSVRTVVLPGGHDIRGNEREPLDEALVLEACAGLLEKQISGVAVSGYFSVRNPSHEIRVRELIRSRHPRLSVTCGHELASELDAFKRATTAAVNAGLIPIVMRLLTAVKIVLKKLGVDAPLSVIKGDGALVSDGWAKRHPVETVLSGPAASAMGARFLGAGQDNSRRSWILDIGGTTTDIIGLDRTGNPLLENDGALIGGHRILVKTIDIRTFGLGGDSRISRLKDGGLKVGPRRAIPLAVASNAYPKVEGLLKKMEMEKHPHKEPVILFPGGEKSPEDDIERIVIEKLRSGAATLDDLTDGESAGVCHAIAQNIDRYEERGLLAVAAFTPTDALLALGLMDKWPNEASITGARIFAANAAKPCSYEEFCREARERVAALAAGEVFSKAIADSKQPFTADSYADLFKIALDGSRYGDAPDIMLKLNANLIGVGAPAWAFLGETAALLGEEIILPPGAEVAGAVGAAVGTFFMRHTLLITPLKSGAFRVHMPDGVSDFEELKTAVNRSISFMTPWLKRMAQEAGGKDISIEWERQDEIARIAGGTQEVLLWSRILFSVKDQGDELS